MTHLIRLVKVKNKYIKFLYYVDKKVMFNKGQRRPYIGILFEVKGHKYYSPLSHPKEKFKFMKNTVDFMRINGGRYGAINFNNMIPIIDDAIQIIDVKSISDQKYKLILINQIKFFDKHETEIINRATKLYKSFNNGTLRSSVANRCCNFKLLEKYSKKYKLDFNTTKK